MKRVLSLDVLRGLTIVGMILVNNPGHYAGTWRQLIHCAWDGVTLADFIFPFFLFIVGASIYLAFSKTNFTLNAEIAWKIVKRSFWIFAIGYILGALWFTQPIGEIRIMAALQRIAIVYLLAAFLVLWLKKASRIAPLTVILLLGYWALQHFTNSYTIANNGIAAIDTAILGQGHMYQIAGQMIDPEGVMGTISSLCNALIGYLFAMLIAKGSFSKTLLYGAGLVAIGLVWSSWLPLNKIMWSSSFAILTSGACAMLWAVAYWVIDVKKRDKGFGFLKVFGTNAIFAYVLSRLIGSVMDVITIQFEGQEVGPSDWLYYSILQDNLPLWVSSLLWSSLIVAMTWALTYILYKRKIYIKL